MRAVLVIAAIAASASAGAVRGAGAVRANIGMTVAPDTLAYSGDSFTVSWTNNTKAKVGDWIGLWMGSPWPTGQYIAFVDNVSGPNGTRISGSQKFQAYNMRKGSYFACLYPAGTSHMDTPTQCSEEVRFALGENEPTHLRLQLDADPGSMKVMFVTNSTLTPFVRFWHESDPASVRIAFGTSETYTRDDLCEIMPDDGQGSWLSPGYIHTVVLTGLLPSERYTYLAGQSLEAQSHPYTFTARRDAPGAGGAPTYPFQFNVYADQDYMRPFCDACQTHATFGPGGGALALAQRIAANDVPAGSAFVAHIGDLGYALNYALVWELFAYTNQEVWATTPVAVTVGNHEYDSTAPGGPAGPTWHPSFGNQGDDSRGECGVPTMHRFSAVPSLGSNRIFWHSFDYGPVHFAFASAETDIAPGSEQYRWLEADLAAVNRTATPWVFLGIHRPAYMNEVDWSDHTVTLGLRGILEPLLLNHSVDAFFSGHYHSYMRSAPVRNGTVAESADGFAQGTSHICVGTAGIGFDSTDWLPRDWDRKHYSHVFAYGRVTLLNATAMRFQLIDSLNGTVLDDAVIRSRHDFAPWP